MYLLLILIKNLIFLKICDVLRALMELKNLFNRFKTLIPVLSTLFEHFYIYQFNKINFKILLMVFEK